MCTITATPLIFAIAAPDLQPMDVNLSLVDNSSCVTLTWKPPRYPNGKIQYYEVYYLALYKSYINPKKSGKLHH